jgi:hypothetical protein
LVKIKIMWVRLKKLGLLNKLYLSVLIVPIITFYVVDGNLGEITIKNDKINEVYMHGLLYDARFTKKDKIKFLDSAIIEVDEIENLKLKKIYHTNKTGSFFIKLPLNNMYQITLKKAGWLNKKIKINTFINNRDIRQFHLFIDAELYRENILYNIKENDFPIIEIHYDDSEKRFITNDNESLKFYKYIKNNIKKINNKKTK